MRSTLTDQFVSRAAVLTALVLIAALVATVSTSREDAARAGRSAPVGVIAGGELLNEAERGLRRPAANPSPLYEAQDLLNAGERALERVESAEGGTNDVPWQERAGGR